MTDYIDPPHLARIAEAHDPEPTPERLLPSGWWILTALFVIVVLWLGIFMMLGVL